MRRPSRTGKALVALVLTASLSTAQVSAPASAQAQQMPAFQMPTLPQFNEEQVRQAITALVALAAGIGGLALLASILPGIGSSQGSTPTPAPTSTPTPSTQPSTTATPTTSAKPTSTSTKPSTSTPAAPTTSVEPSPDYAKHVADIKERLANSEDEAPLWAWASPRGPQLNLPTHEGSGQATHPSVLYFENGWNGWKYWMAMTPYPASDEGVEDPNVVVSNDGWTWQVPDGLTNPIDDQLGKPNPHNSDTQLVMAPSGEMYLTWRMVDRPNGKTNRIFLVRSTDGVHWSEKEEIWTGEPQFMSQALIWTGENWRLYGVANGGGLPNRVVFYESPDLKTWSTPNTVNFQPELASGQRLWHIDIQLYDGEYIGLVHIIPGSVKKGNLYLLRSKDGISWERSDTPIISHEESGYPNLYKSALVPHGSGYDLTFELYYSGFSDSSRSEWRINRTIAQRVHADF
ncbi:exo-alpha-sialidase [Corynebacterium aurimucosum]|uniref:sialidase family protein n=1 Tax=Corynebacterium TaxID=1716 RepID=UPI000AB77DE3|nr:MULTISPECIES: sialidase family protein [Corynebacterium]MBE7364205.1 exo-alpha-sialidase [Corynebacterium aurimucosum]